jgi:hypothetical protein
LPKVEEFRGEVVIGNGTHFVVFGYLGRIVGKRGVCVEAKGKVTEQCIGVVGCVVDDEFGKDKVFRDVGVSNGLIVNTRNWKGPSGRGIIGIEINTLEVVWVGT